jgi:hypothetical protein
MIAAKLVPTTVQGVHRPDGSMSVCRDEAAERGRQLRDAFEKRWREKRCPACGNVGIPSGAWVRHHDHRPERGLGPARFEPTMICQ